MTLIIDGYNVIGAWQDFRGSMNLQESREKLVEILSDYAGYTGDRVILVFDAYASNDMRRHVEQAAGGVEIVFTRSGETADHYIERLVDTMCRTLARQIEIYVATSDAIEQSIVMGRGAARISSNELRSLIFHARTNGRRAHKPAPKDGLEHKLPADVLEKLEQMRKNIV